MSKYSKVKFIPAGMEDDDDEDDLYEYDPVQKTCQNMKITIVPDITIKAGLNDNDFDATLPDDIKKWFDSYREMWNIYKKTPAMVETLRTLYLNSENPLLLALKLFVNCPGSSNSKHKTLPNFIFETVSDIKDEKPEIIEKCDENLKMVAFNFVKTQGLPSLYKTVTKAYDLCKDKNLFEDKIKDMITKHNYKDASHWVIILGLTDKFGIFDLIFPLILQDKIFLAEEYLDNEKSLQRPTIELLDSLLDKSSSVKNKCDEYIGKYNYPDVKYDKLYSKPLTKLIIRLSKKYNLPLEATPNVARSRSYGYLQYLIHKKYVEKSLNDDSWRELVIDALSCLSATNEMKLEFITMVSYNYDMNEAVYWVEYYNLPIDELPSLVRDHIMAETNKNEENDINGTSRSIEQLNQQNYFDVDEIWDNDIDIDRNIEKTENHKKIDHRGKHLSHHQQQQQQQRNNHQSFNHQQQQQKEKFYKLKLDYNQIILVQTSESFQLMLNDLQKQSIISFDSEWKPSFQFQFSISLIQIAKYDKIYLIDAQSKNINDELWSKLGKDIFNNLEIIKIGFSLNQDLIMFQKSLPSMNISTQNQTCYIDLQELWKKLLRKSDFHFPYKSVTSNETLSQLVENCLGQKLDKSNQFSNWGKRPLRKDQIIYAALDAYCLLEIYEVICLQLDQIGIDLDHVVDSLNEELKAKSKKNIPPGPNIKPVRVSDVKFVCDNMLEGLAKSLRKFGIDCLAISSEQREYCIEIAVREHRYLLTKGYRYARFSKQLPLGHCYKVRNESVDDQLSEVLKYFNIKVNEDDIFSRCQICNCNEFLLVTNEHLKQIKNSTQNNENIFCDKLNFNKITPPTRNCIMNKITSKLLKTKKTSKGAVIQVGNVSQNVFDNVHLFFICERCGKCYWDGSHWEKVITGKLKNIILKK